MENQENFSSENQKLNTKPQLLPKSIMILITGIGSILWSFAYGIPGLIGWEAGSGDWGATNNFDIYNSKYNYHTLWTTINK